MTKAEKIAEIERLLNELWDADYKTGIVIQLPGYEGTGPYLSQVNMSNGGWEYSDGTCNGRAVEYDSDSDRDYFGTNAP